MSEKHQQQLITTKTLPEIYLDNSVLRALVQMIPSIGPIIDAFLSMPGTRIKEKRLNDFIDLLFKSIKAVEQRINSLEIAYTEEFYDTFNIALDASLKSRSKEKLIFNVMIIANLLSINDLREFRPEEYIRLLSELTPTEVKILSIFYSSYSYDSNNEEEDDLKKARRLKVQERIKHELGIENNDDLLFLLYRLERTGFIREIPNAFTWEYTGGLFTITSALTKLMEYLSYHPFSKINFEDISRVTHEGI